MSADKMNWSCIGVKALVETRSRTLKLCLGFLILLTVGLFLFTKPVPFVKERGISYKPVYLETKRTLSSRTLTADFQYDKYIIGLFEKKTNAFKRDTTYDYDSYRRDSKGYLYHSRYFNDKDSSLDLLNEVNLKGRHSDYVLPPCNDPNGVQPHEIDPRYNFTAPFKYLPNFKNPCWYDENNALQCIPYAFIIGTAKAGTSDLIARIRAHPDVIPVWPKEQRWFNTVRFRNQSQSSFKSYLEMFKDVVPRITKYVAKNAYKRRIFVGDDPTTTFWNKDWRKYPGNEGCIEPRVVALSHMHRLNPKAKLIINVRKPPDWLYSAYLFNFKRTKANGTKEEFHVRATNSIAKFRSCFSKYTFRRCIYGPETVNLTSAQIFNEIRTVFSGAIYSRLILDVLRIFPREQVLIRRTEDDGEDPLDRLRELYTFLDLAPMSEKDLQSITKTERQNQGTRYVVAGDMLPETRRMLDDFFRPFNEELAYIMNDSKFLWKDIH